MRIVSLIASATEIVHALGAGDQQVGRSHECDFPKSVESLPVCTAPRFAISGSSQEIDRDVKAVLQSAVSVYQVFDDVLEDLEPSHIITQSQCEVCALSLSDVERALSARLFSQPKLVSLQPDALEDVWKDILAVAGALEIEAQGKLLVERLQGKMEKIATRAGCTIRRPRVICIEWIEPLMAAGNWMPELVEMAGGVNLFGETGQHSGWMQWEGLAKADPDVIVTLPCGFDLERTEQELYWLSERPEWNSLQAVRNGQVFVTDGNQYFNRPGPRLVESLRILAEILHPEEFEASFEGLAWKQVIGTPL